jgi:large subunit ribosomal protein L5
MNMARLQQHYREKVVPELTAKFGYKSPMEVPRLTKITLNMGVSEAVADKKVMDHAVGDLTKIAGQKPVVTKATKGDRRFQDPRADKPLVAWSLCAAFRCTNSSTVS